MNSSGLPGSAPDLQMIKIQGKNAVQKVEKRIHLLQSTSNMNRKLTETQKSTVRWNHTSKTQNQQIRTRCK